MAETLIHLQGVDKVSTTDDVETHASPISSSTSNRGDYISIAGRSGCGKSTLLAILGSSICHPTAVMRTGRRTSILLADEPTGSLDSANGRR